MTRVTARFQFLGDADGCNHQITWYKRLKKHWTIAIPAPYHSTTQKWSPHNQGKGDKGAHKPKTQTIRAYTSFFSMKHARSIATPVDGMLVHRRVIPQQYVAGTHLYKWVKRDKVRQSSLSNETTRWARLSPGFPGVRGVNNKPLGHTRLHTPQR